VIDKVCKDGLVKSIEVSLEREKRGSRRWEEAGRMREDRVALP